MNINFEDSKLEKICNDDKLLVKTYGKVNAKKIKQRLDDLKAATKLEVVRNLPGKYHDLYENRKGQIAVHIEEPYRLIFKPNHAPLLLTQNGNPNWELITSITVIEIVNYHGK